eukprot:COSAG01_NODE_1722_length_9386_cov_6.717562_6_plen_258_part_00
MSMVELEKLWGRHLAQVASVQQERAAEAERSRAAPPTDDRAPAAARGAELAHLPGAHMLYLDTALAQWLCRHTQSRQLRAAAISALQAGPVSAEMDNSVVTWAPAPSPAPDEPSEHATSPAPDVQAQVVAAAAPPPPRRGGVDVVGPAPPPSSRPWSSSSYADRAAGSTCRAVRRRAALSAELSAVQMGHLREREAVVELPRRRRRRPGCGAAAAGRRWPTGALAEQPPPPPPPPQREQLGRLMTKGGRIFAETCFG